MAIKKRRPRNDNANEERAHRGASALQYYCDVSGNEGEPEQEMLTDLLTDLRHLSTSQGLDFEQSARMAQMHYEAETEEEDRHGI